MSRKNKSTVRQIELGGKTVYYELFLGSYKNINLRIRGDGSIRVSADRRIPPERVESFLFEKEKWIEQAICRLREAGTSPKDTETLWRDGGRIPIFGRERTIQVKKGRKRSAILNGDQLLVTVPDPCGEEIRGAIRQLMEREIERKVTEICGEVLQRFSGYDIPAPNIRFRYMVSRWGSCCPHTRTVTLNKYLACVPKECIEYVIAHELAHFLELNHSRSFWAIVEKILPEWKARKQELILYGILLRRF